MRMQSLTMKTCCFSFGRSYEALIGVVSHDTFDWLSDKQSQVSSAVTTSSGVDPKQRDRVFQVWSLSSFEVSC